MMIEACVDIKAIRPFERPVTLATRRDERLSCSCPRQALLCQPFNLFQKMNDIGPFVPWAVRRNPQLDPVRP
jgi:hypothetical protein